MADVRSIKIKYGDELRRLSVESLQPFNVATIEAAVRSTFPSLANKQFRLTYIDDESDIITVTMDVELDEAMAVAHEQALKVLRFDVHELTAFLALPTEAASPTEIETSALPKHERIICDGCGMSPIVGMRFKCSVRNDFDLCEACERNDTSAHAFLKIKSPAMAPAAIMTILRSDQPCDFAGRIAETEERYGAEADVIRPEAEPEVVAVNRGPFPSHVVLECAATVRRFGPYSLTRKLNHTLVFRGPEVSEAQPYKEGGCLHIGKRSAVDFGGAGGNWASFHVELLNQGANWSPDEPVRLICANRKSCLAGVNGRLIGVPACQRGPHTLFKILPVSPEDAKAAAKGCRPSVAVHHNVVCDKSGMSPIVGPRFHVPGNNFDLCEAEFNKLPECERFLFVKIEYPGACPVPCMPSSDSDTKGTMPELKAADKIERKDADKVAPNEPSKAARVHWVERAAAFMEKLAPQAMHRELKPSAAPSSAPAAEVEDPDLAFARLVSETWNAEASVEVSASKVPVIASSPTAALKLEVSFVDDVTLPDGTKVSAGEPAIKVWRMRNDSDVAFPDGVRLVHVGGDRMGAASSYEVGAAVLPLEEFELTLPLISPETPGMHTSFWALEVNGIPFGHRIWVQLRVEDKAKAEATLGPEVKTDTKAEPALGPVVKSDSEQMCATEEDKADAPVLSETLYDSVPALEESMPSLMGDTMPSLSMPDPLAPSLSEESELSTGGWEQVDMPETKVISGAVVETETAPKLLTETVELDALSCSFEDSAMVGSLLASLSEHAEPVPPAPAPIQELSSFVKAMDELAPSRTTSHELSSVAKALGALAPSVSQEDPLEEPASELSASVQNSLNESYGKWASAVDRLFDMGFMDMPAIVALCEKHATPETVDSKFQVIIDELLSTM